MTARQRRINRQRHEQAMRRLIGRMAKHNYWPNKFERVRFNINMTVSVSHDMRHISELRSLGMSRRDYEVAPSWLGVA